MKETKGDFWDEETIYDYICVTTNGMVKNDGCLVMGAGMAKQFAIRYPELPRLLGVLVKEGGNRPYVIKGQPNLVSFPTKHDWRNDSDIRLIADSAKIIRNIVEGTVLSTRPGCGLGGLDWHKHVRPMLEEIWLEDRFTIISPEGEA